MGHQTIPRLNQYPRYYLFFPLEPFSMNNCPPNQWRACHSAETICCMISQNVSTGLTASPHYCPGQDNRHCTLSTITLTIRQNFLANNKQPALTGEGTSAGLFPWRKAEKQRCKNLPPCFLPHNCGFSQPLKRLIQDKAKSSPCAH